MSAGSANLHVRRDVLLGGLTGIWADLSPNFFQPLYLPSSNWVNVNAMCGHMPLIVNPDCGRTPDPIVFWLLAAFGFLALAIVTGRGSGWVMRRWPGMKTRQLFLLVCAWGLLLDLLIEIPVIALGLWTWPAGPLSVRLGDGYDYPMALETVCGGLFFILPATIRIFRDDRGRSIVERGLERLDPRFQRGVTFLSLFTLFQIIYWIIGNSPYWLYGMYVDPMPERAPYVINDVCDAPGVVATRYGICPGDPGYRMPGRHSLPGESP